MGAIMQVLLLLLSALVSMAVAAPNVGHSVSINMNGQQLLTTGSFNPHQQPAPAFQPQFRQPRVQQGPVGFGGQFGGFQGGQPGFNGGFQGFQGGQPGFQGNFGGFQG